MVQRVVEQTGGERVIEREVEVSRGMGAGGVILALLVLALVAFGAFYVLNTTRNDNIRTDAVAGAASSVGKAADNASKSVSNAADQVADGAAN